jgi:hypothetical protein
MIRAQRVCSSGKEANTMKWSNQKMYHVELTNIPCSAYQVTEVPERADTYWGLGTASIKVKSNNSVTGSIDATVADMLPLFYRQPDTRQAYILIPITAIETMEAEMRIRFSDNMRYSDLKERIHRVYSAGNKQKTPMGV